MTDQTAFDLDTVLPAWEANYEPGNVSDYLIGYANDEAAAKGAAIAWLTSQSDKNPATLEWVEMPTGDQHDHWFNLIQNAEDGMALDIGINVRHRLPSTVRGAARTASGQQPETAACACKHPQDRHLSACTECPCIGYASTWPPQTTGSEGPDPRSACPTFPCRKCAPAVGQPAEAQATDEARPPRVQWGVEYLRAGAPEPWWDYDQRTWDTREKAQAEIDRYAGSSVRRRLVREDTTWTVEDETR